MVFYQWELEQVETAEAELKSLLESAVHRPLSSLHQALFGSTRGAPGARDEPPGSRGLLPVLEVCENILEEMLATKGVVNAVGPVAYDLKDNREELERL